MNQSNQNHPYCFYINAPYNNITTTLHFSLISYKDHIFHYNVSVQLPDINEDSTPAEQELNESFHLNSRSYNVDLYVIVKPNHSHFHHTTQISDTPNTPNPIVKYRIGQTEDCLSPQHLANVCWLHYHVAKNIPNPAFNIPIYSHSLAPSFP